MKKPDFKEFDEPIDPVLVPGRHGNTEEVAFVNRIIREVIRGEARYRGPIDLVGSRVYEHWVSKRWFDLVCGESLSGEESERWFSFLNQQAKKHNYARNEFPLLVDDLPVEAPEVLKVLLEQEDPGADFDISLRTRVRPSGILEVYHDEPHWQMLDVFVEGEM